MTISSHPLSPQLQRIYDDGVRAAASGANILIIGESGIGREALARRLHGASPRAHQPLVVLNLAALPRGEEDDLYGSRLAGARTPEGALERAHGGVLLLDDLGEFEIDPLRKLRAALEARSVLPAGASERVPADVQLFALHDRDLQAEVDAGERSPEYLELTDVTLVIPPLRERRPEIRPLAEFFLAAACTEIGRSPPRISAAAMAALEAYAWPGNIRELRNVCDRALVLCEGAEIGVEHLPDRVVGR